MTDAVRGVFGEPDPVREERLAKDLLEMFDQATSIEPAHRYTDARGLAAGFERMTRLYLEVLASGPTTMTLQRPEKGAAKDRAAAEREARDLSEEVMKLRSRLERANARLERGADPRHLKAMVRASSWRPPLWWEVALVLILLFGGLNLLLTAGLLLSM